MTTERALSFGAAAVAYERFRPGYPDELITQIVDYTGPPLSRALEIGAGTGKATRALVGHGIEVLATEPDPEMLAMLRRVVPNARTQCAPFEEAHLDRPVDLVYAAAAMHWTAPDGRWERVAALLRPGGTFASFGGPISLASAADRAAETEARSAYLGSDDIPSPDGTPHEAQLQWPATELVTEDAFEDVRQLTIERRWQVSRDDYVGMLSTVSAYRVLAEQERSEALGRILDALPTRVDVTGDLTLHLARRTAS